jgi:hypothetical protein
MFSKKLQIKKNACANTDNTGHQNRICEQVSLEQVNTMLTAQAELIGHVSFYNRSRLIEDRKSGRWFCFCLYKERCEDFATKENAIGKTTTH